MKLGNYKIPKSAFLSAEKDTSIIIDLILKNNNLKKLLYYTSKDCLSKPNLTEEQSLSLLGEQVKIVPKLYIDPKNQVYIIIRMRSFLPDANNPEFRDNIIEFDIVCNYEQWQLNDFALRPYKIAGEIDSMISNQRLTGIGETQFHSADQLNLNDQWAGFCLTYLVTHGEEDKKFMPNPNDEQQMIDNFNEIFNS